MIAIMDDQVHLPFSTYRPDTQIVVSARQALPAVPASANSKK